MTITAIVCAHNEARYLPACLHSLRAQTRLPDSILVIDNASTDSTGAVARAVPGVRVIHEPEKGLVVARETARRATASDILGGGGCVPCGATYSARFGISAFAATSSSPAPMNPTSGAVCSC